MKEFFKLVLKFTGIMLVIILVIMTVIFGYIKITGKDIDLKGTPLELFTEKETKRILIAGLHPEGNLTDFIMVVQYNPVTKQATGLSIPRDTKVIGTIDGKINSAYAKKKDINALKEKVKELTSLSVDNYVILDTKALIKIIDAIGGVPINVPINMKYDDYSQDLHIDIKKGQQTLTGAKAEEFIRFRKNNDGTGYPLGDIQRIQTQQEFIKSAVKQLLNAKNIVKIPELIDLGVSSVKGDVKATDVLKYLDDIKQFNTSNLRLETLPGEGEYINNTSYFVADIQKTKELVNEMFFNTTNNSAYTKEKLTIEVLNATSTQGLAARVADKLKSEGYNVTRTGNDDTSQSQKTSIIDRTTNTTYAKDIKKLLNKGNIKTETKSSGDADITIIIGEDY
jgi:LCP family protein required for cell wall assembly